MYELVDYAKENIETEIDQARFFYQWIGTNIKYDYKMLYDVNNGAITNDSFFNSQKYFWVYETRKGVCAGYANLFKWFMDNLDIECSIIVGYIRDERNKYVSLALDFEFSHGWNAVRINDKWILVDSTWGTSGDPSVSEFYFNMKPDLAIITHYPEDSKWQLLEKPLTLEKFNKSKFVKPIWFFVGFSDIPQLKTDKDFYYFVYKSNENMDWGINLMISEDNLTFHSIEDVLVIKQDGFTYVRFDKTKIPEKAFYKVNLLQFDYPVHLDVINFKT
tara:strand:- start:243 stop:1067 length:825 start_codon:yes stop_codon:yes gene_type:complete